VAQTGFGMAPVVQATMLIAPIEGEVEAAIPIGPGCNLCPREDCTVRR
jgi:predicted transcriptional regulator